MGQDVKNPLRAQSKYGLMGSSAKTGKKFFEGHRSTFWIKMPFGIGHPPPTHQSQSTCVGEGSRVPNLQTEFNYLDLFKSYGIFSDFVVPTWSPSSPSSPHHPHVVPVILPLSPHHPHHLRHPHVVPIAPRRSPCGLHGLVSTCCPRCPHHPHIVPVIPMSSPCHPRCPCCPHVVPIAPRRSPCGLHGLWSPHVVPVIPTLSPSSPHCLEGPHIIPKPPDTHSTQPPPPCGVGAPNQ